MKKIIFVDDEIKIIDGLKRMLHPMRKEWDMEFVDSGQKALDLFEKNHYDIIVSDMRMPETDGLTLLTKIAAKYPDTVRIILSGFADKNIIMNSVGVAHQYLAKPTQPDIIKNTVERILRVREILSDERLKKNVGQIRNVPSLPLLYHKITQHLLSQNPSIKTVADIIAQDLGMSAKILQMVNSSFFGVSQHVKDITQAMTILGIETVKTLVLSLGLFSQMETDKVASLRLNRLWNHSINVANLAKKIAQFENASQLIIDNAYISGMLHDIGRLVMGNEFTVTYKEVIQNAETGVMDMLSAERKFFHTSHCEVGAYLMGLWGFENSIIEAVLFHHDYLHIPPEEFSPACFVFAANQIEIETNPAASIGKPIITGNDFKKIKILKNYDKWKKNFS